MPKKKRWEDKVFNWIYRSSVTSEEDTTYLSERILDKKPVNNIIYIYSDPDANRRIGFIALAIFALILFFLGKGSKFSPVALLFSFLIGFPFLLFGIAYLRKSRRFLKPWYIHLTKRQFLIGKVAIPFDKIDRLSFTRLQDANEFLAVRPVDYSYQLNFEMKDAQQLTLFTDKDRFAVTAAGEFISSVTGIPLDTKIHNG